MNLQVEERRIAKLDRARRSRPARGIALGLILGLLVALISGHANWGFYVFCGTFTILTLLKVIT